MRFPLVVALGLCALALTPLLASAGHAPQNDAGTGGDAGDSFATATPLPPHTIEGVLDPSDGDSDDWYRFHVELGEPIHLFAIYGACPFELEFAEPVRLVSPEGVVLVTSPACGLASSALVLRPNLIMPAAPSTGEYRLHLPSALGGGGAYYACRTPCAWPEGVRAIGLGDTYHRTTWRTLVFPPAHGDLGNPDGPSAQEYLDATLDAIDQWPRVLAAFAADHPEYSYLSELRIEVAVFDGTQVLDTARWDAEVHFEETHPYGRGFGGCGGYAGISAGGVVTSWPAAAVVPPRAPAANCTVVLTLVNTAGMAGEMVPDSVSLRAVRNGVFHEFGHVFGIIHTTTLVDGLPDLMTSPAPYYWGDGSAIGSGGVEVPELCVSSLDLQAIAYLYRWIPTGRVIRNTEREFVTTLPYELYC